MYLIFLDVGLVLSLVLQLVSECETSYTGWIYHRALFSSWELWFFVPFRVLRRHTYHVCALLSPRLLVGPICGLHLRVNLSFRPARRSHSDLGHLLHHVPLSGTAYQQIYVILTLIATSSLLGRNLRLFYLSVCFRCLDLYVLDC